MAAMARITRKSASLAPPSAPSPSSPSEGGSTSRASSVPKTGNAKESASKLKSGRKATKGNEFCPKCASQPACASLDTSQWVACDQCSTWYHWICIAPQPSTQIEQIDKWYCYACSAADPTLVSTYREPPRKSSRATAKINYANLDAHTPCNPDRFISLAESKNNIITAYPKQAISEERCAADGQTDRPSKRRAGVKNHAPVGFEGVREMAPEELTTSWLLTEEAMTIPIVIPAGPNVLHALDMEMPPQSTTISDVAVAVGPDTPIEVIDVASQTELSRWTLGQWAQYYEDPQRDKVRNVISLEISDTALGKQVKVPRIVREMDWVHSAWPQDEVEQGVYPKVAKYCLMSVARCWTDWHIDFAGSSVFYHILKGSKTFYFIRPTPENLRAYEKWSSDAFVQDSTWLGDQVDHVFKVDLAAGDTMLIPTGFIHAVYTPSDSLVIGGNFIHSLNIGIQLRVYEIENSTRVPKKARFPYFLNMLWCVGVYYLGKLGGLQSDAPLPDDVSPRILNGLAALAAFLLRQARLLDRGQKDAGPEARRQVREAIPWHRVPEPKALAKNLRKAVRKALGQPLEQPGDETGDEIEESPPARKRKAGQLGHVNSDAKPTLGAGLMTGSTKDDGVILSRSSEPAKTERTQERRKRLDVENASDEEVEVKSTRSKNSVVRKLILPDGRVAYETRTMTTEIVRTTFSPPGARTATNGTS